MVSAHASHFIDSPSAVSVCRRALVNGRPDAVVVGLTAAALWGMPLPPSAAVEIERGRVSVSRRSRDRAWRGQGISGHAIDLPDHHVTECESLQVTTPVRTWLDCAALVSSDHLLAMGDWSVDRGLMRTEELLALISWGHGRRGVVRAREVAALVRRGVDSPQESRLRWLVVSHGLPEPTINPVIVLPDMSVVRLDLAYVGLRLGMEFDGDWHVETQLHDAQRRSRLARLGWEIVVARKDDLSDPQMFLRRVRAALAERRQSNRRRW